MATAPDTAERDYFTDKSVLLDPYDFFEEFRAKGPVVQLKNRDMLFVTGFKEAVEVLLNKASTSFRALPERDRQGIDAARAKALMIANPTMIKRPVLDFDGRLLVGFKPDVYTEAFSAK